MSRVSQFIHLITSDIIPTNTKEWGSLYDSITRTDEIMDIRKKYRLEQERIQFKLNQQQIFLDL